MVDDVVLASCLGVVVGSWSRPCIAIQSHYTLGLFGLYQPIMNKVLFMQIHAQPSFLLLNVQYPCPLFKDLPSQLDTCPFTTLLRWESISLGERTLNKYKQLVISRLVF